VKLAVSTSFQSPFVIMQADPTAMSDTTVTSPSITAQQRLQCIPLPRTVGSTHRLMLAKPRPHRRNKVRYTAICHCPQAHMSLEGAVHFFIQAVSD